MVSNDDSAKLENTDGEDRKQRVGDASARFARVLAELSPTQPTREELLSAPELVRLHPDAVAGELPSQTKTTTSRALTRMIGLGLAKEVVIPNTAKDALNLPEMGLVAASVSITQLYKLRKADKAEEIIPEPDPILWANPNQEGVIGLIKKNTRAWMQNKFPGTEVGFFVHDIWIVHGSDSFDILIRVSFRDINVFMEYIRSVIHDVQVVSGTQTMLITSTEQSS